MSRTEFSKPVKRAALDRAAGKYECCGMPIVGKRVQFDHIIPDGILANTADLSNCMVMCAPCHLEKTTKRDVPTIAKAKRISDKFRGITGSRSRIKSQGFRPAPPQHTATRPVKRKEY